MEPCVLTTTVVTEGLVDELGNLLNDGTCGGGSSDEVVFWVG